jgi:hypothetical protein
MELTDYCLVALLVVWGVFIVYLALRESFALAYACIMVVLAAAFIYVSPVILVAPVDYAAGLVDYAGSAANGDMVFAF